MRFGKRKIKKQTEKSDGCGVIGATVKKGVLYNSDIKRVLDNLSTPVQNCEKVGWRQVY